jgi:hypothetical protein
VENTISEDRGRQREEQCVKSNAGLQFYARVEYVFFQQNQHLYSIQNGISEKSVII